MPASPAAGSVSVLAWCPVSNSRKLAMYDSPKLFYQPRLSLRGCLHGQGIQGSETHRLPGTWEKGREQLMLGFGEFGLTPKGPVK